MTKRFAFGVRCGAAVGALSLAHAAMAAGPLPSFPGAEGFGAVATGGRGGAVYHVTNLEDKGAGSFREAVSKGPRVVVFDVGGYVGLKSAVTVASDVTIAGQTAPGQGIGICNYEVSVSNAHNIIVRYVRFRQGLTPGQEKKYVLGMGSCQKVIVDHCSIEWGRWDCIGMSKSTDITVQNCIIGEGIDPQRFGCLCESDNVTFSHNLWINNDSRNPKAKGKVQYVNNVVYNWGKATGLVGGHSGADHAVDVINNYFIKGPSSSKNFIGEFSSSDHVFSIGNMVDMDADGVLNGRGVVSGDFGGATDPAEAEPVEAGADLAKTKGPATMVKAVQNVPGIAVTLQTAAEAYARVMKEAGCSLQRDAMDERLIEEARSLGKKGQITHDPKERGGLGVIEGGAVEKDTDGDGIPDAWEAAHGMDAKDAADGVKLTKDGYTQLEVYVNGLTQMPAKPN